MPLVDLGSVRLCYELAGTGPALLILGGTGSDLRNEPNPLSWPVARGRTVLAHDHRGLGQSVDLEPEPPTMADFAADAVALVDHVGWERFSVLGVSFGGMVAQEVALLVGDRLDRLVLACTSSGGAGGASYPLHELSELPADERLAVLAGINDVRLAGSPSERASGASPAAQGATGAPEAEPEGLRRQLEARRHHDTHGRLPKIEVPVLVTAGRYDGIAPVANSEAIVEQLPHGRLEVFEGGHTFLAEDLSSWSVIDEFLAASPARATARPGPT
ncbi:MAG: alpha/beta hydrolase fold [Acidimicrobiales bacterium]|nr:alpha/beta hydrolase fold [Acidimicrobiales bacterium]